MVGGGCVCLLVVVCVCVVSAYCVVGFVWMCVSQQV